MIARGLAGPAHPLALFLVLVAGAVAVEAVLLIGSPQAPYWMLMTLPGTGLVYAVVGALAWVRRPSNGMGALFCAGAVVWLVTGLVNTDYPAFIAAGQLLATVPVAIVLHALLAFPSGRLTTRPARTLAALGYLVTTVVLAPQYLFTPLPAPYDPLFVADRPDVLAVLNPASTSWSARSCWPPPLYWCTGSPPGRQAPVGPWGRSTPTAPSPWSACGGAPRPAVVARVGARAPARADPAAGGRAGGLRGGGAARRLRPYPGAARARDDARPGSRGPGGAGRALTRTLGDPSARVLFRVPAPADSDDWVDASGTTVGQPGTGRARTPIEVGDRTVGAPDYDRTLFADDTEVRAASGVVALAVDHERLTVELLAGRAQLRESRLRLLEAGDRERRRLAQDLHDRLQGRLVLLAITADGPDGRDALRRGIDEAIDELRRIVQGVMPALLLERGLTAAVRDLAARSPLPVDVEIDAEVGRDLPASVESTAYLVVAEAVTNAVKHASAARLAIGLERCGPTLRVRVADDGDGGAVPSGTGLQGTIDRVTALEGSVRLDSPPGHGTRLVVELPCVS